jgi:LTXXQ motif family protein
MSKLTSIAAIVLVIALSGSAYSAPGRGGGGGHGGGAAHVGGGGMRGGGGAHFGGGGGRHFGGGGGRHFGGGGRHFSGGGVRHFSHGGGRHYGGRFKAPRSTARAISRGGGRTAINASGKRTFGSNRNANQRSRAVHRALNSRAVAGAMHHRGALRNPGTRARIAATAATAGWHNGHGRGWWRHGHGGYGWVGPLFWPFAYYDMYGYAMWGYGDDPAFWDYGYNDIYAGMFAPYGYDDLTGYLPPGIGGNPVGTRRASRAFASTNPAPDQLTQMCGDDSRDIAGLPIDQIQQAIQPSETQRTALDDLANASVKAAQFIKAACPAQISLTAPARLAAMQQRIEAMIAAVGTVQPPLEKFYGLLNDEQKARLNALGQDQRRKSAQKAGGGSLAQSCGATPADVTDWPAAEIDAKLHPTDAQRASLTALQDASANAADLLKHSCQPDDALTPPARLSAVGRRLDVMLQAVKTVRTALDDFYGKLTDEQKAQFEAIGPGRAGLSRQSDAGPTHARRRHHAGFNGIIRHFMARW